MLVFSLPLLLLNKNYLLKKSTIPAKHFFGQAREMLWDDLRKEDKKKAVTLNKRGVSS